MDRWKYKPAGDFGLPAMESVGSLRREAGLPSLAAHLLWLIAASGPVGDAKTATAEDQLAAIGLLCR